MAAKHCCTHKKQNLCRASGLGVWAAGPSQMVEGSVEYRWHQGISGSIYHSLGGTPQPRPTKVRTVTQPVLCQAQHRPKHAKSSQMTHRFRLPTGATLPGASEKKWSGTWIYQAAPERVYSSWHVQRLRQGLAWQSATPHLLPSSVCLEIQ